MYSTKALLEGWLEEELSNDEGDDEPPWAMAQESSRRAPVPVHPSSSGNSAGLQGEPLRAPAPLEPEQRAAAPGLPAEMGLVVDPQVAARQRDAGPPRDAPYHVPGEGALVPILADAVMAVPAAGRGRGNGGRGRGRGVGARAVPYAFAIVDGLGGELGRVLVNTHPLSQSLDAHCGRCLERVNRRFWGVTRAWGRGVRKEDLSWL